jgi:hypothetical protein
MKIEECRLMIDRGFEETIDIVSERFHRAGFRVTQTEEGDRQNWARPGEPRHYAVLNASLPELSFPGDAQSAVLGCRLSIFALTPTCTLLAAETPLTRYPALAVLIPRVERRIHNTLAHLTRESATSAAA